MGLSPVLLIESDSSRHLGLFSDVKQLQNVDVLTYPNHINIARKALTTISPDLSFETVARGKLRNGYGRIVIVDTALARMNEAVIKKLRRYSDEIHIIVLNSIDASSPSFEGAKKILHMFPKDHVHTFDKIEAERYGFSFLGLSYYSMHDIPNSEIEHDVYFAGGLKGGREQEIIEMCRHLGDAGLDVLFECVNTNGTRFSEKVPPGFKIVSNRWVSYERILDSVSKAGCIIEVLQHGQHAQSIRYFEAVCYNKNLLTNNPYVKYLPYYNPKHMIYFSSIDEINCNRIAHTELPDFGYVGEFSPANLELLK